jgi:hypothetical protein
MGSFQKTNFYTSQILISKIGYVKEGKIDLLTNLHAI